ncbi:manganese efflux pump MntP family protein [Christensenellaceae bacterium OttesenSCG-928-L17]|nr:manganese efflux pump MntP family protein [Christensenellaceae bacterium OttesenSCG-928-L17]
MSAIELVLLAVALALDAFAVSVTEGIRMCHLPRFRYSHAIKVALLFGAFQAIMPLVGYLAGSTVLPYIENFDHWIAMGLLAFIGIRMIVNACKPSSENDEKQHCVSDNKTLFILAIATSVDALAIGISLAITQAPIFSSIAVIGGLTAVICFVGIILGERLGTLFQKRAEIVGGAVLIVLGIKIVIEHLMA